MIKAAGILFVDPNGKALFLRRGPGGDHPNEWYFPGGATEGDETAEQTAVREAIEEIGSMPKGDRSYWTRSVNDWIGMSADASSLGLAPEGVPGANAVDFTTFLQKIEAQFPVAISDESTGYAWAPLDGAPEPLHPGCRVALARFGMNELDIARAIAAGELTSPQKYHNIWLFAIRITGTASAFRAEKRDPDDPEKVTREAEFVYRRPATYLNDDFLARCNGLPVVVLHPEDMPMPSAELTKRFIGTSFVPFIRGTEIWTVAKIFNEQAAREMETTQLSTSPGVLTGGDNSSFRMEGGPEHGKKVLIEGDPEYVEHIALVPNGVWDKGGEPSGVDSIDARMDAAELPPRRPLFRADGRLDTAMLIIGRERLAHARRVLTR